MVAVLAALVSSVRHFANAENVSLSKFQHTANLGIPLPQQLHRVLDSGFIADFDEVLIVGDVHGCFDEMQSLLRCVSQGEYMASRILKIFVGDLVNKGPKSREVIQYMIKHRKECLSVRGNHDEVVLREYFKHKRNGLPLETKNAWIKNLNEDEINYLVNLPYTIAIPSLSIVLVHAGLVPGQRLEDTDPHHMVSMRNLLSKEDDGREMMPSKEDSKGEPWASLWRGPQHIYFGHDAKRMLQKYNYATGLDTGCVYGKMLTGVFVKGPRQNNFVHVNAAKVYSVPGKKE